MLVAVWAWCVVWEVLVGLDYSVRILHVLSSMDSLLSVPPGLSKTCSMLYFRWSFYRKDTYQREFPDVDRCDIGTNPCR